MFFLPVIFLCGKPKHVPRAAILPLLCGTENSRSKVIV
jgi:hypothetical protein